MSRRYSTKDVAEDYLKLSIFDLRRYGFLVGNLDGNIAWTKGTSDKKNSITVHSLVSGSSPHLRLVYNQTDRATGDKQDFDYKISIVSTPCYYGGERDWFICPLVKNGWPCGKRVAVLYKVGDYFGCRYCNNLSYESRNENPKFRDYPWKAYTIEDKLEKLQKRMKRKYYAGRPTKTYMRILDL